MSRPLTVAAVGASAGGVEALRTMFREVPTGSNIAFVVLLHLDPDRTSSLPDILSRECALDVVTAEDGMALSAGRVFVVPPGVLATVVEQRIKLAPGDHSLRDPRSIDVLFSSVALDLNEHAIGVVLSGFGSDGTLGIKAIKEHGGLTVAQGSNGSRPGHGGMPDSAIAGGLVDLILPVEAIPAKLVEYAASFGRLARLTASDRSAEEQQRMDAARHAICDVLRHETNHDFSSYKEATFFRRVQRRMQVLHATSLDDYLERLRADHDEALALLRDLMISVTSFFRDEEAYAALAEQVIPRLFDDKGAEDAVRVWVPGCATGEEAYSIAMLLSEHVAGRKGVPRLQVFATDIDEAALQVARAGRYPLALLDRVTPARLRRFFTPDGSTCTVGKEIRDICVFSSHSLIRDPPFSRLDLVSCRNLLIYLDADAQADVFPVFHFALRPRSYLFLGSAESASQFGDLFIALDKQHRIYQRRDHATPNLRLPLARSALAARGLTAASMPPSRHNPAWSMKQAAEAAVLERFSPPHVVVNREGEVVHYSSHTGRYLEAAPGQPTSNVAALARRNLRLDVRAALQEALESRKTVTRITADADPAESGRRVSITVTPLVGGTAADPLFLIVFTEAEPKPATPVAEASARTTEPVDLAELELLDTRNRLQTLLEQYETAVAELRATNEEMVSVNEELQSANEELETSKEEQQSVNEELQTVNQDLNAKVEQLDHANADLKSLFDATRVATITLDRDLAIRSFTPQVAGLFNLLPSDVSRPLADIAGALDTNEVLADARRVLEGGQAVERSISRRDGSAHYLSRTVPYRSREGSVDGVVAAFVEITPLVEAARLTEHQKIVIGELNHRMQNVLTVVISLTRQTLSDGQPMNEVGEALIGRLQALSEAYKLVLRQSWGDIGLTELVQQQLGPHLTRAERGKLMGPRVMVSPASAVALGLVLHELATNAIKYGALSNLTGTVTVSWTLRAEDGASQLVLDWVERGGPRAKTPSRQGLGSQLISGQVEQALGGTLEQRYEDEGFSATITLPWTAAASEKARSPA